VRECLKSLLLLRQVGKRGCYSRFKLICRFGVSALPNLMLANGIEEGLRRTEAALSASGANFLP
jgi:hypothetical protein